MSNGSFEVKRRWDMGQELDEAGNPRMSSAVRPVAITPDEKIMYAQVSFFHGLVEFNMAKKDSTGGGDYELGGLPEPETGEVTQIIDLPIAKEVRDMPREEYVLDSAHHGLAINESGSKLCVAGTMSDYAAIVDRKTFSPTIIKGGRVDTSRTRTYSKPYWAVEGPGQHVLDVDERQRPGHDHLLRQREGRRRGAGRRPPAAGAPGKILESIVAGSDGRLDRHSHANESATGQTSVAADAIVDRAPQREHRPNVLKGRLVGRGGNREDP